MTSSPTARGEGINAARPCRVLVVDDDASIVEALKFKLAHAGYEVVSTSQPMEALARLYDERFELLITDLHMPQMDGVALLCAGLAIDPHLMGIIMTGRGATDTAVAAMKAGAFDYLVKPFQWEVVSSVLARAIEVRQLRIENEGLDQRLRGRTAELEAANKELEAFAHTVSHDLRAPLRAIMAFNELIEEELEAGPVEKIRDYSVRVQRNAERMSTLIEDLLRLGQTAQCELRRGAVDLGAMAREISAKLQTHAGERAIAWTVEPDLIVRGDQGLLQIMMENLLSNAWKYTSKTTQGRVQVGVETRADGERVFYVRDNGVGFDLARAGQLFVPFHRLHSETEFAGTGVGLATVQRIVAKHGGRIWAQAATGLGATFHFTLP